MSPAGFVIFDPTPPDDDGEASPWWLPVADPASFGEGWRVWESAGWQPEEGGAAG